MAQVLPLDLLPCMQVVFSRPVIALGSDFGSSDNFGGKVMSRAGSAESSLGVLSPAGLFHSLSQLSKVGRGMALCGCEPRRGL